MILTRNGAAMLDRLFSSLAARNTQSLVEIILVDHGSTDATPDVVRRWAGALPITHVRFAANHSYSWSANRAAERARGEYLVFLNNDIVLTDDILPAMLAQARQTGGIVGVRQMLADRDGVPVGRIQHVGVGFRWHPDGRFWNPFHLEPGPDDADFARQTARMTVVTGSVMMVKRSLYLELGGHDEAYFYGLEDVDFCLKAGLGRGFPVTCMNGIAALHSEGSTRGAVNLAARRKRASGNFRPYIRRWDYLLRRHIRLRGLTDDVTLLGVRPPIALAGPHIPLLDAVARRLAKQVCALDDVSGPAVVCVTDPRHLPLADGRHCPSIAIVGLVGEDPAAWLRDPDLSAYDLLVADDRDTLAALRVAGAAATCQPAEIREALVERAETPRVGLPCVGPGANLRHVRMALAKAGIASRARGAVWLRAGPFSDEDVIVRGGLLPLLAGPPRRPIIPLVPAGTLVERVLDADRAARRPPRDAPLPDLSQAPFPEEA